MIFRADHSCSISTTFSWVWRGFGGMKIKPLSPVFAQHGNLSMPFQNIGLVRPLTLSNRHELARTPIDKLFEVSIIKI